MTGDSEPGRGVRIDIERCHLNGQCTQRWDTLEPVRDEPRVRFCGQCRAAVHLAEGEDQLAELARLGKNVAVLRDDVAMACAPQLDGDRES